MRWNCPHCGTDLAVSDEKLDSGWTFTRCYKCAGFGLIRRPEVNLIKIDQVPNGEQVLLPEGAEMPRLSQAATQHLARSGTGTASPPPFKAPRSMSRPQNTAPGIPAPLPEKPEGSASVWRGIGTRIANRVNLAIGASAAVAVISGVVLVAQGRSAWVEARQSTSDRAVAKQNVTYETSDSVHQKAMAPLRESSAAEIGTETSAARMRVKLSSSETATLRSGPGEDYPVIGVARPDISYVVKSWKDRWFRVLPADSASSGGETSAESTIGWIRNDQVRTVH